MLIYLLNEIKHWVAREGFTKDLMFELRPKKQTIYVDLEAEIFRPKK